MLRRALRTLWQERPWASRRNYHEMPMSEMRNCLDQSTHSLVGVGQLAARSSRISLPRPQPFGFHFAKGTSCHELLQEYTIESPTGDAAPGDSLKVHARYAIRFEFPWFPLLDSLQTAPDVQQSLAEAIPPLVRENVSMARRWWFAYELFHGPLQVKNAPAAMCSIPFLPPNRFFCTAGIESVRHGIIDNLLGNKDFCPFVEKFAGSTESSLKFRSELLEILSPICMTTMQGVFDEAGLDPRSPVTPDKLDSLVAVLVRNGFSVSEADRGEFRRVLVKPVGDVKEETHKAVVGLVAFAQWLRGYTPLASRLREHLLGVAPVDLRWHAPGELFLERLSRVISSVETRASQMIENELPPDTKQRFFVDVISKPWKRDVVIDKALLSKLQRGLLSSQRYADVCKTQVDGEPFRTTQNWVSSEKYDEFEGKARVLHMLPPPPETLPSLLDGYVRCVDRIVGDPDLDPIVCATVVKIAFNTLHPLVDGNGRVQRALFQLVLFKHNFLPRMNVPVSVVMLQDRTAYELMQQTHIDQVMFGVAHGKGGPAEDDPDVPEGEKFQHLEASDSVKTLYKYQDFTFAASAMLKLMHLALPVIAAKAYFLQRFDWRVDELLKGDALLPPRAATRIAKVFKNDGSGVSIQKLLRLIALDGWWIGLKRIKRFFEIAARPEDNFGWLRVREAIRQFQARSDLALWMRRSGQLRLTLPDGDGRMTWVGLSMEKFATSERALITALRVSRPGDTVVGVHYPMDIHALFSKALASELEDELLAEVTRLRDLMMAKVNNTVILHKKEGVNFEMIVGKSASYKPAHSLIEDASAANIKPYRIYLSYDESGEHHGNQHVFADHVIQNAPCDVAVVKNHYPSQSSSIVRWVGISSRNFHISSVALKRALHHANPGDTVVAVYYPVESASMFGEGLSSVYERHLSSLNSPMDEHLDTLMDNIHRRTMDRASMVAEQFQKKGVIFMTRIGRQTMTPGDAFIADASCPGEDYDKPTSIYVGYTNRQGRNKLVEPHKTFDFAEFIVRNAPCTVVIVKDENGA
eukprot:TRINITY_DN19490_c0_g1_i1.p1 TRINITY_DN19490_c0_g1~~TRINITY_DN19490_c0_g1_i1.p1  ORF type:complete len:1036 (+),score=146.35 TRINITY_DN19490_c0_g1_i1:106-3213(+)